MCLAERLEPRAVQGREVIGSSPLVVRAGAHGTAVLLKYGCVVFFGLSEEEETREVEGLGRALRNPFPDPEVEAATVVVDPDRDEGPDETDTIRVRGWDVPRIQVVAEVLAKSVALAHYEGEATRTIDRIEPLAERLSRGLRPRARQSTLLQELGDALLSQARTIGRAEVAERPELIWELPTLGRLYERLSVEYELMERDQALRRKNEFITGSVGSLIDLVQQRQSVRLEWYIVILILVEIVILVYDMFVRA
jgi:uncharacterized Rmd1/YagE family protein